MVEKRPYTFGLKRGAGSKVRGGRTCLKTTVSVCKTLVVGDVKEAWATFPWPYCGVTVVWYCGGKYVLMYNVSTFLHPAEFFRPDRCWIGSINKTTLKMKVQTLSDISSLTSCSLFGSLSTNHWAGPQEVTICGRHGDRVCGWALRLMCYLEQMKYDTGAGRERARRCREGNGRDGQRQGGVMSPGRQRAEPQRNRRRRAKL
ncbi:hypothetical protein INR49_019942 [Caranx melampygus]|nr:hypothetical protein INR49_019942 [Caranx melampygus]